MLYTPAGFVRHGIVYNVYESEQHDGRHVTDGYNARAPVVMVTTTTVLHSISKSAAATSSYRGTPYRMSAIRNPCYISGTLSQDIFNLRIRAVMSLHFLKEYCRCIGRIPRYSDVVGSVKGLVEDSHRFVGTAPVSQP